jgi:peptidoglycan hydrolase CwlO-like protein
MHVYGEDVFNMNDTLILLISNTLTAIAGWFVGRKRQQAETDNAILRNMEIVISSYKSLIDDLKVEIQNLNIKVQDLEKKIDELHKENKILKSKVK